MTGTLFDDRYLIDRLIARGGMGNIYKAHDTKRGHIVAVKMLRSEFDDDAVVLKRFLREAHAVQNLHHPNICQLYDIGCTRDKIHYFTMEFLEGDPLDKVLREKRMLPPEIALKYIMDIAAALCDAHNHNIIHRDLKPANIFIVHDADGKETAKLLDFGLAKLQEEMSDSGQKLPNAGSTLGTPFYMAPEQIQGFEVDGRADVYSLGIILWECLFGAPPFLGKNIIEIFSAAVHQKLPKLTRAYRASRKWRSIYAVLDKALKKEPKNRYDSMQSFLRALEQVHQAIVPGQSNHDATQTSSLSLLAIIHTISPLKLILVGSIAILAIGAIVSTICLMIPSHVEIPQTRYGIYKFFSDVPAEIRIDDEYLGTTPYRGELYNVPPFKVTFRSEDDKTYTFDVDNYPEDVAGFAVSFSKSRAVRPMVFAETTPEGADIYVNDHLYPLKTPCQIAVSTSKSVKLTFKLKDYLDENILVLPNNGELKIHTNLYPRETQP